MFDFSKKKNKISFEILIKMIWVSSFLAMILTLPSLGLFLGIYYFTGELVIGAIIGGGVHFITLAFISRISKFLTKIMS